MKARWKFEPPQEPLDAPWKVAWAIKNHVHQDALVRPLSELLAQVQYHGGWEDAALRYASIRLLLEYVEEPGLLRSLHECDSRIIEGEQLTMFWTVVLAKRSISVEALVHIFRKYDRPKTLGGAPFDWFVANYTNWSRDLLVKIRVNPDGEAPPAPRFLDRMLTYRIPEADYRVFVEHSGGRIDSDEMLMTGAELAETIDIKSILALIAQETMSLRFILDAEWDFVKCLPMPPRTSAAARERARVGFIIVAISRLWLASFYHPIWPENGTQKMLNLENCIFEWIPEIREDVRFSWALDALFDKFDRFEFGRLVEPQRSFERLRGASIAEKPIRNRLPTTGALLWEGEGVVKRVEDLMRSPGALHL